MPHPLDFYAINQYVRLLGAALLQLTDGLDVNGALHGEREGEEGEGIEPHTFVVAHLTPHHTLQLYVCI